MTNRATTTAAVGDGGDEFPSEEQHLFDIVNTFCAYKKAFNRRIADRRHFIASDQFTKEQRAKFAPYILHLAMLETAAEHNQEILKLFAATAGDMFQNAQNNKDPANSSSQLIKKPESQLNTDRLNSVLHQLAREWTSAGAPERAASYDRILAALERYFPVVKSEQHNSSSSSSRSAVKVLVPGSGLGRLPFEIARRGFSCQGNEFSLMMLLVSNYVLNESEEPDSLSFYPYIGQLANNLTADAALTRLTFPDVCPSVVGIPPGVGFSMAGGSFLDVYGGGGGKAEHRQAWDAVVSCFFLDTAPNVLEYIELVEAILKPAGVWINFGPLMYHWTDGGEGGGGKGDGGRAKSCSVEPTYEMVHGLIEASGFEFVEEEKDLPAGYTVNPHSMLSYTYKCVFFVARKKPSSEVVVKTEIKVEEAW